MRNGIPCALALWLLANTPLFAQTPAVKLADPLFPVGVAKPADATDQAGGASTTIAQAAPPPEPAAPAGPVRFWVRTEYMMWWVKNAPQPISLVTTGNPQNNPGGELLNSEVNYSTLSGFRLTLGAWLDGDNNVGVEANYFFLGRRHDNFFTASDSTGNPTLAIPFTNLTPGAKADVLQISSPGLTSGNVLLSSSVAMWGTEVNSTWCLFRLPNMEFSFLLGYRHLDLEEDLSFSSASTSLTTRPNAVTILSDSFSTHNQFNGGQLGLRAGWENKRAGVRRHRQTRARFDA